jgi:hypothetical protein
LRVCDKGAVLGVFNYYKLAGFNSILLNKKLVATQAFSPIFYFFFVRANGQVTRILPHFFKWCAWAAVLVV